MESRGTHCKYLHGYAVSFRVWFEGELDERNWVFDFGGMKRAKTKIGGMALKNGWIICIDHTTIIAEDDPTYLDVSRITRLRSYPITNNYLKQDVRDLPNIFYHKINDFLAEETNGRVKATKVEVYEHERNSASYGE
jgi:6-pyruvoyltetrahydropterin/6-carboxytetrahydropterin synthase